MELDDLKKAWNEQQPSPQRDDRELIRQIIHRSHKGLTKMMRWELAFGLLAIGFVLIMILIRDQMISYYLKLSIPLVAFAVPVYYRLYRSATFLRGIDFSGDVRSTLSQFLVYYTRTLRVYQWGSYGAILLSMALIFTDERLQHMNWTVKGMVIVFMCSVMLIVGPLVKRMYGSKAKVIREYLDEKE